jgi:hypothetical protein
VMFFRHHAVNSESFSRLGTAALYLKNRLSAILSCGQIRNAIAAIQHMVNRPFIAGKKDCSGMRTPLSLASDCIRCLAFFPRVAQVANAIVCKLYFNILTGNGFAQWRR